MTNPAISALANDLKNSAQQYQQQQAGKLASLLHSQPQQLIQHSRMQLS